MLKIWENTDRKSDFWYLPVISYLFTAVIELQYEQFGQLLLVNKSMFSHRIFQIFKKRLERVLIFAAVSKKRFTSEEVGLGGSHVLCEIEQGEIIEQHPEKGRHPEYLNSCFFSSGAWIRL